MLKRQAFLRNPSSCQPYLTGKEMRAQKGEQTTWNDLHASVWQVTSKHSNFRVSTEFLQQVLIAALLCPSLISSGCDILWKKKKTYLVPGMGFLRLTEGISLCPGWQIWQRYTKGHFVHEPEGRTQSHFKTKSELWGHSYFFLGHWLLSAICQRTRLNLLGVFS